MTLSLRSSQRIARLGCEILEGRNLLSVMGLDILPPAAPLVVGHASLYSDRVTHALDAVDQRLLTEPVQATARGPITVDLNQDGLPDTLSLWQPPGTTREVLRVVYGASPGTAPQAYEMALDHLVSRLIVADFDGDGRLDIFARQGSAGTGTLLLGTADGTFDAYRQGSKHYSFAVGDLAGSSGDPLVYYNARPLPVLIDKAVGAYPSALVSSPGLPATDVQLADINGDGTTDLVVTEGDGSVWMYAGQGAGEFSSTAHRVENLFDGDGTVHVAFANLDGPSPGILPGKGAPLDMVVASTARSEVAVFLNQGNWSMQQGQVMHVGLAPSAVTVADIHGDGIPDLIVTCAGSNSVWIFKGLGNGQFDDVHPEVLTTGADPESTYVGHFADPHQVGLVTLDREANALTYYPNAANPSGGGQQISSGGTGPSAALVRNVNPDGYSDLIVANHDDGRVTLFQGGKDGLHETQTIDRPGTQPAALAAGPGLQSPYQFYVLNDGSSQAEVLSFSPLPHSPEVTEQAGPPDLGPTSSVTLQLQPASETTADLVPTLLSVWTEPEVGGLMLGVPRNAAGATPSSGDGAKIEDENLATGEKSTAGFASDSLAAGEGEGEKVQRFLLGVDEVPPPPLKGAGFDAPPAPAKPYNLPEPIAQANMPEAEAMPITEGLQTHEEPPSEVPGQVAPPKEVETLHLSDLLLGVVILFGPVGIHEMTRPSRTLLRSGVRGNRVE